MLKEREKHEYVRIVSKKLKPEKESVLQEKLKAVKGTQYPCLQENIKKRLSHCWQKVWESAGDRDKEVKLVHVCFFSPSPVFTKVFELEMVRKSI